MGARDPLPPRRVRGISGVAHSNCRDIAAPPRGAPFQRCDHAFGRWFVGGHVGSQSDLCQRADGLGPGRDLACGAERSKEDGFQIEASSKTEEPPQTFTRHQHKIAACPSHEPAQPRLYSFSIRCIADGDHWTGDSIGPAPFQHAEQLTKLAGFRHYDPSAPQLFPHASPRFAPAAASGLIFCFNLRNGEFEMLPASVTEGSKNVRHLPRYLSIQRSPEFLAT